MSPVELQLRSARWEQTRKTSDLGTSSKEIWHSWDQCENLCIHILGKNIGKNAYWNKYVLEKELKEIKTQREKIETISEKV
jgi:hypothetical protein